MDIMTFFLRAAVVASLVSPGVALAQIPDHTLKIGVLNDMNGPYADLSGKGSVIAAQMAAEDFAASAGAGAPKVVIVSGDHQNKADVGAAITRRWVDTEGVGAVVDVPNSAVALAVNQVLREKDRTFLASAVATSDLTGSQCAPTTVQWSFDTWALANGTARAVIQNGGKSWFFLASDYALGAALVRDTTALVKANGGTVVGDVRMPLGSPDMSSYLVQAQSSGAQVIGIANAGEDAVNTVKQATEFGIAHDGSQRLAGLLVFTTDIKSMGLATAQGLLLTESFYWDLNPSTRAWSARFAARDGGRLPTSNHAAVYSSVLAYLKSATAADTLSGSKVMKQMESGPIDDALFGPTTVRPDGRAVHAMYLFRVKTPAQSKGDWDFYNLVATIPAAQAFRPMSEGGCKLVTP
jgi:branched-chain amino acid transport system substrate-binding protein